MKQLLVMFLFLLLSTPYLTNASSTTPSAATQKSVQTTTLPQNTPSPSTTILATPSIPSDLLPESVNPIATLSDDEVVNFLTPLLSAQSEDNIVDTLVNIPIQRASAIVEKIIATDFPRNLIIQVIFGVATHYMNNPTAQKQLFVLLETKKLIPGAPPLFIAAQSSYPQIIPPFLAWAGNKKKQIVNQALRYAVAQNGTKELTVLKTLITPEQASELLWYAVDFNGKSSVLQILIDRNANIEQTQQGKTLLLLAVERLNPRIISLLIKAADTRKINRKKYINKFIDPNIGTPLQLAIRMQNDPKFAPNIKNEAAQIELLLIKYGASENV
ncbi:MAG TPA: ankyrin repeat domain-containing protein [Candidatus Babeliales bacterium]|nr:ankyrin repeat domain-containing protein [Candidatus Babeliales bacterium]